MFKEAKRAAWAEIDLANIDYNINEIKKKVGEKPIIAVVKADGYGHGSLAVSQVLLKNGVKTLAVATLQEAINLREGGLDCPIIILGITPDMYADIILAYRLIPTISSLENARTLAKEARNSLSVIDAMVAVDTGMGRIGYLPEKENISQIVEIAGLKGLRVKGIISHFATADEKDKGYANEQLIRYENFIDQLSLAGVNVEIRSFANSAAVMEMPSAHFDAVRPGIILYGCYPSQEVDRSKLCLRPAMSVKANIVHLKKLPLGSSISYGRKFITGKESLIATLPLGYADGYPRFLTGKARVIVNGSYAPVVGSICMDQCMVDVSHVANVKLGDEVVLMGSQGQLTILADEIGEKSGTINYEVVCGFGQRLPKIYL